jgi:hypothetical protein
MVKINCLDIIGANIQRQVIWVLFKEVVHEPPSNTLSLTLNSNSDSH